MALELNPLGRKDREFLVEFASELERADSTEQLLRIVTRENIDKVSHVISSTRMIPQAINVASNIGSLSGTLSTFLGKRDRKAINEYKNAILADINAVLDFK